MISFEKHGLQRGQLQMPSSDQIQIGQEFSTVHDTGVDEDPSPGVHIDVLDFDDPELAAKMNAAYFILGEGKPTLIEHFTGPRIFIEKIIKGSATWIGVSPEGEVVNHSFNVQEDHKDGFMVYGNGWLGCWVAGPEGAEILEICIPPFEEDNTITVAKPEDNEVDGVAIPLLFQTLYRGLLGMSKQ